VIVADRRLQFDRLIAKSTFNATRTACHIAAEQLQHSLTIGKQRGDAPDVPLCEPDTAGALSADLYANVAAFQEQCL
jgi:hypothetical protein